MEDVYPNPSIISFDKVPCTPVTGAYVNFFDVFGDVERAGLGTGSSHDSGTTTAYSSRSASFVREDDDDELHERANNNVVKIISSGKRKSSRCYKHNAHIDPHIAFLQEKQVEILGALHDEIRTLKSENAELKFQIHVILNDSHDVPMFQTNLYRGKMVPIPSTPETYLGDLNANRIIKDREKTLELELESAAKMIEELKWVKSHYEKQIQGQEIKIADLERQLRHHKGNNCNSPSQITTTIESTSMIDNSELNTFNRSSKSGKQRSSSTNHLHGLINRRNSSQSLLPDDYKKAVATLPPILGNFQSAPGSPINNVLTFNIDPSASNEEANGRTRKSAFTHSQKRSLGENNKNNNIPSFIGEKNGHLSGPTHFYYSK